MSRTYGKAQDLIDFTRASGATYLDSDGVLKTASNNIPRIEYDANGNLLGLLVEESRTNLVPYSEDFGNAAWNSYRADLEQATITDPAGGQNSYLLTSNDDAESYVLDAITITSGATVTFSGFMKAGTATYGHLIVWNATSAGVRCWYNLESGTVGSNTYFGSGVTFESASITDVGNGWYRCSLTVSTTGTTTAQVRFHPSNGDGFTYSTVGKSIYIYGAQLESASFPTSYIPTSGSTATRSADVASLSTSAFGYRQDEGSVVIDYRYLALDNNQRAFELESDSANFMIHYQNAGNTRWYVATAGSSQANLIADSNSLTDVAYKFAGAYKANDFAVTQNGAAVVSDTSGAIPYVDTLRIGNSYAGANQLNGHIKSIKYIPRRLTNEQLQELTS